MTKAKVYFRGLLIQILIPGLVIVVLLGFNFPVSALVVGVMGLSSLLFDWAGFANPIKNFLAKPLAEKFFYRTFELHPPSKKDWLAMKVCQQVVSEKLKELKKTRDDLFERENLRIKEPILPQEVNERVASLRKFHDRVNEAKSAYENAGWLAYFFNFNIRD